jgi:long-chain acyl-CoA synthetase
VYSNLRNFKSDFQRWRPHYLVVVPRLIETIQKGVVSNLRQQTGAKKTLVEVFTFLSTAFKSARRTYSNAVLGEQGGSLVSRLVASLVALFLWPLHKLGDAMVWRKVRQNLGGRLKVIVSGGSLLPLAVEKFYQMLGLNIIVGYGLTETSPTITSRLLESNVLGSVGKATPKTTIKIVNPDTRIEVSKGKTG